MSSPDEADWTGASDALLALVRAPSEAGIERLRELTRPPFNWDALAVLAESHVLWPIVLERATAASLPMPAPLAGGLRRRFIETTALNLTLTAQLVAVMAALERRGIPAVALKGPTLAGPAYGHLGLRPFVDLDVLVTRETADAACAVMRAEGYRDADRYSIVGGVFPKAGREYAFEPGRAGLAAVEIQVDITSWPLPIGLPPRDLIARARPLEIGGRRVLALSPEDQVLSLAVHGTRHLWNSLRYVTDIDAAARGPIDWALLVSRARGARMSRMLFVSLLLARDLVGTHVPSDVLAAVTRDRGASRLASRLAAQMFSPRSPRYPHVWTDRVSMASREHLTDKVRYLMRIAAFERIIRPLDDWRSVREHAAAWRSAKIARRVAIPLLILAAWLASASARPLLVGTSLTALIVGVYLAVHYWAARTMSGRPWFGVPKQL